MIREILPEKHHDQVTVMTGADFVDMEAAVRRANPDLIIGHSKGYSLSRKLDVPPGPGGISRPRSH